MDLDTLIRHADPARHLEVPAADIATALAAARGATPRLRPTRRLPRLAALTLGATVLASGVAVAAGEATGVIDLGGGQKAIPVAHPPIQGDAQHPYVYQVTGLPTHRDGTGAVYIESAESLATIAPGQVDSDALVRARQLCAKTSSVRTVTTTTGQTATLWVFDAGCDPTRP